MFSCGLISEKDSRTRLIGNGPSRVVKSGNPLCVPQFFDANRTRCEANGMDGDDRSIARTRPSPNNPYKDQIEQMQKELDEPCRTCMLTGMAVCTGLSLYFVKLATDKTTLPKNRRFLWVCSASWATAGLYRWYLG